MVMKRSATFREAVMAFSFGMVVASVMLMTGFWDVRKRLPNDDVSAKVGDKVMIQSDCEWVQVLVSSVPTIKWTSSMSSFCGGVGTVIAVDTSRGVVKLRHENGARLGWPITATSISPKKPHSSFTSGRLRRASHYVDSLEERLNTKHRDRIGKLLTRLHLEKYLDVMIQVGLDTLEIIVASEDEERDIAKIEPLDWKQIKESAETMLASISKLDSSGSGGSPAAAVPPVQTTTTAPVVRTPLPTSSFIKPPTKPPQFPDEDTQPVITTRSTRPPPPPPTSETSSTNSRKPIPLEKVDTVSFIHIPKAGGTAFTTALRSVLGCSLEACEGFPHQHQPCPSFTGCYDHNPLRASTKEARTNGTTSLLAVNVRHPVERIISAYHHGSREWPCCGLPQKSSFKDRLYRAQGREDAFTVSTFSDELPVRNCMTKMMIGKQCKQPTEVDDRSLSEAVQNLQLFDVVLIQEYVPESLKLLSCVTGNALDDPALHKEVRKGNYKDTSDEDVKNTIKMNNSFDVQFYEKAIERFCEIYKNRQCDFELPETLCS